MATLREQPSAHKRIGLGSSILIYLFEAHPAYSPLTEDVFRGIEAGNPEAMTSTITLMELTVRPWQPGRADIARECEALLVNFPHLTIASIDREVARRAAQLRAAHGLRPADALQVATTLAHLGDALLTNDRRPAWFGPVLEILILDDYLSQS